MTFDVRDIWYVWILGRHKHNYVRIEDEETFGIFWQRHRCTTCEKVVGLDDWQIADSPPDISFKKIQKKDGS